MQDTLQIIEQMRHHLVAPIHRMEKVLKEERKVNIARNTTDLIKDIRLLKANGTYTETSVAAQIFREARCHHQDNVDHNPFVDWVLEHLIQDIESC